MKVSELKTGQGKVDIDVVVKSKGDPRVMNKYGKELKVANAVAADDSGEVALTLWNDDVDKVAVGNTVKITNGYVSEFQGKKQLTSGKFGKLEVVGVTSSVKKEETVVDAEKEKKAAPKKKAREEENDDAEEASKDDVEEVEF